MMNPRIIDWLNNCHIKTPQLVIDLEIVQRCYQQLRQSLSVSDLYYAVRANSEYDILRLLVKEGAGFEVASLKELDLVLQAGADVRRVFYGHCVKKSEHIAYAWQRGVRMFAFDTMAELEKIAQYAPHSEAICHIAVAKAGSKRPITKKFGCLHDDAIAMLKYAQELELMPKGIVFHVGSQQEDPQAFAHALKDTAAIYTSLKQQGITLGLINIGGGFPSQYQGNVASFDAYGHVIGEYINTYFAKEPIKFIASAGRAIVADAGILATETVLACQRTQDAPRWVYLDVNIHHELMEAGDHSIHYRLATDYPSDAALSPCVIAGHSYDSADVLYEKHLIDLPQALKEGDRVYFLSAGAYLSSYALKEFDHLEVLSSICLPLAGDMPLFSDKIISLDAVRRQKQRKKRFWG